MNATNNPDFFQKIFQDTPVGTYWGNSSKIVHVLLILGVAVLVHFIVKMIRWASESIINRNHAKKFRFNPTSTPKFITLLRLIVSTITFIIYFLTVGLILVVVFHFNDTFLKTYLSSAAVVGLALSFGLQGLVQDVVTGLTLIISNTIDVGDIVDLSGVIGHVERIGLRFTKVINFFNQEIYIPNRNIANVARFSHGGVYAFADVQVSQKVDQEKVATLISQVAKGVWTQFGAIILSEPQLGKIEVANPAGWSYLRVQFKIWPGQTLIETAFRPQMVAAMKPIDPDYADWMVQVTYRAMPGKP